MSLLCLANIRRDRLGSQEKLAKLLGVSVRTVSRWETGEALPTGRHLRRIAEQLEVEVPDLFARDHQQELLAAAGA